MENVRVYNLRDYMIKENGKQTYRYDKIMILVGDKGVVVRESEGCGWDEHIITDSIPVQLNDYDPEKVCKSIYIMPQYETFVQIEEIINNAAYEDMPLKTFMDRWNYNDRLRRNFRETLKSMADAGIDVSLYVGDEK